MRPTLQYGDSVKAVLSGAITTTNPTYSVNYTDLNNKATGTSSGSLAGVTLTTLQTTTTTPYRVDSISIYNGDTAAVTVTLSHVTNAGTTKTLTAKTLAVGDTLVIDDNGLVVTDSSGQVRSTQGATQVVADGIDLASGRNFDATTWTVLGATPASADDFGLTAGTFLTSDPTLRSSDAKATTVTSKVRYAYTVPSTYVSGEAITLRAKAGMVTTVSDTTATIDAQVVRRGAPTVDICATSATTINSLTSADVDFVLTPTNVVPGDVLDIVMTTAVTDGATGTAVIAELRQLSIRPTVRV